MAFGGKNLKKLFVTTSRLNMEKDQIKAAPLSGGLFVIDVECESMQGNHLLWRNIIYDLTWEQLNGLG